MLNIVYSDLKERYLSYLRQPTFSEGLVFTRYRHTEYFENFQESDRSKSELLNNPKNIWFISDQHFNHKSIIDFANRPFNDLLHMENILVEQHNQMVQDDDIVIFVGDFGFCNKTEGKRIFERLNGYKILVMGNHDIYHGKFKDFGYKEVYISLDIEYNDSKFIITHYPMEGYEDTHTNIHGHVHKCGRYHEELNNHFNVNCEFINYTPINIDNIR